jgi:TonB family protein
VSFSTSLFRHTAAAVALFLALSAVCVADVPAATAPAEPALCPIGLRVDKVKDHDDELVFSLWSDDEAGKASGTFILYGGTQRYRIAFVDTVAADRRNTKIAPTPDTVEAPACAKPYVTAYTPHPSAAEAPMGRYYNGPVVVMVVVGADGKLLGQRVEKSSRQKPFDDAALAAAAKSGFAPQIYRCEPVTGDYLYVVVFSPT